MITPHAKLNTLAVIIAGLIPISANALTLPVAGDTYIDGTKKAKGSATSIVLKKTNQGLVKYDLSKLPTGTTADKIASATLYVYVNKLGKGSATVDLAPATAVWNEATQATTPVSTGSSLGTKAITTVKQFVAFDVTQTIKDSISTPNTGTDGSFALKLDAPANNTLVQLDTKEATGTSQSSFLEIAFTANDGATGPVGPIGPQGIAGPTGAAGAAGVTGPTGPAGFNGLDGAVGPTGPAGLPGLDGPTGPTGPVGPTGTFQTFQFKVGDTGPGGGIVFFVDRFDEYPGITYLEAAVGPTGALLGDSGPWCSGAGASTAVGATGSTGWGTNAVGAGPANTTAMLTTGGCTNVGDAAEIANTFFTATTTAGEWFLPSAGELMLMYNNLREKGMGGFDNSTPYWSSTEFDNTFAYEQDFDIGDQNSGDLKTAVRHVVPVRIIP